MEYKDTFIYLSLEVKERKNAAELKADERNYVILNLLDRKNTPCKFFVFKKEVVKKLLEKQLTSLEEVEVLFEVVFNNNNWNVRLLDIE